MKSYRMFPVCSNKRGGKILPMIRLAKDENLYRQMIHQVLGNGRFYFSPHFDVTLTCQKMYKYQSKGMMDPLDTLDPRFFWNQHLGQEFMEEKATRPFFTPIMDGFYEAKKSTINGKPVEFVLISRRSKFRTGTRFNCRGIDEDGDVANFVETEQIIYSEGRLCSYVSIRGSIPLFWNQLTNFRLRPPATIEQDTKTNKKYARVHYDKLLREYGSKSIVSINLINQKGDEAELEKEMSRVVSDLRDEGINVRYVAYDFHKECSKMRWHRLGLLVERVKEDMLTQGYFSINIENKKFGDVKTFQNGAMRVNCMDNLDRTNVVQSVFSKYILIKQLVDLRICNADEVKEDEDGVADSRKIVIGDKTQNKEFLSIFRNVWADNANQMSKRYSGSDAMKTDFTRTGKRTTMGKLHDGYCALLRFYLNNLSDGRRQDALDLFVGDYVPDIENPSPFSAKRLEELSQRSVYQLLAISFVAVLVLFFFFYEQTLGGYVPDFWIVKLAVAIILTMAASFGIIQATGSRTYVDRPLLSTKHDFLK